MKVENQPVLDLIYSKNILKADNFAILVTALQTFKEYQNIEWVMQFWLYYIGIIGKNYPFFATSANRKWVLAQVCQIGGRAAPSSRSRPQSGGTPGASGGRKQRRTWTLAHPPSETSTVINFTTKGTEVHQLLYKKVSKKGQGSLRKWLRNQLL